VQRIDTKIAVILKRQAEEEHGRRNRPQPPECIVELGIGARKPPLQVHAGHCYMAHVVQVAPVEAEGLVVVHDRAMYPAPSWSADHQAQSRSAPTGVHRSGLIESMRL
jgi:hypothetical protein